MKKTIFFLVIPTLLFCSSCQKNPVDLFTGDYTYKTSGTVDIIIDSTSFPLALKAQTGQMDIIELNNNDSNVIVVMNELGGNVVRFNAQVVDDSIFFDTYTRSLSIYINDTINGTFDIAVSGKGVKNQHIISITEIYDGVVETENSQGTIYGDNILTIAKRN